MQSFIDNRLSNYPKASIFDPIKKIKTPDFTVSKTKVCTTNSKIVPIESSNQLFSKISIISQKCNIDMKMLLTYPLGCVPLSLAEADASLRKTAKSVILHKIEGNVEPVRSIPKDCAYIIDGMAALRQLPIPKLKCRELANRVLETILTAGKNAKRIGVVFDIYTKNSIKHTERNRRSKGSLQLQQIIPASVTKQWDALLSSNNNKNKLISFFVEEWKELLCKIESKTFYVNSRKEAFRIISEGARREEALDGDHQEADVKRSKKFKTDY